VALAVTMLFPFVWMFLTSFMSREEALAYPPAWWPKQLRLENYVEAITLVPFLRFLLNSLIMTGGVVLLQLITCSTAAYAFARLRFRGRDRLFTVYLATLMVPPIITMIPVFLLVVELGWKGGYLGLIVPYAGSAWGVFLLRQFLMTLPRDVEDAARLDGAGELQVFARIILPLCKPALSVLAVFAALSTWQEFLWPLVITDTMEMRPLSVGLAVFATLHERHPEYQMAGSVLAMLPMAAVFAFGQRYFLRGTMVMGAQK
jgi:multiple sugar transport system permease protein